MLFNGTFNILQSHTVRETTINNCWYFKASRSNSIQNKIIFNKIVLDVRITKIENTVTITYQYTLQNKKLQNVLKNKLVLNLVIYI